MRFNRLLFAKQFALASRASSGKLIEQYGNVRLRAVGGEVTLTGTDTEIYVQAAAHPLGPCEDRDVLLPADKMAAILAETDSEEVELIFGDKATSVVCGPSRFSMQCLEYREFFVPEMAKNAESVTLPVGALRAGFRSTVWAVDNASTRYQLGGIAFDYGSGSLSMVGCDGRRASVYECQVSGGLSNVPIVPERAAKMLITMTTGLEGECTVSFDASTMWITLPDQTRFSARLVEGRYPNWRMVEPNNRDANELSLNAGSVLSAMRRAAIMADKESRRVDWLLSEGQLLIKANVEVGASEVTLPIAWSGDPITIVIDHKFVTDFMQCVDDEPVSLRFRSGSEAIMLMAGSSRRCTIMPMSKD